MVLVFIANLEGTLIHLNIKKKENPKKKFLAWERGGCPLKCLEKWKWTPTQTLTELIMTTI